jgi:hypothetical protein
MPKAKLTPDEVISTLQHTNVPTIVSEGKGDLVVLRKIEDRFADSGITVLAAGGRDTALKVFARRNELPDNQLFLFFVDQDCWVYVGVPDSHTDDNLFYTDGYSIENDMFRDGELFNLMTAAETILFKTELERFISWYTVAVERHLADNSVPIATAPNLILDSNEDVESLLNLGPDESLKGHAFEHIIANYGKLLRGKSLFGILMRQLSAPNRAAKYSNYALLEFGASRSGVLFDRVSHWVNSRLDHYRQLSEHKP